MFKKASEFEGHELMAGISLELLCHGDKTLMGRFLLKKGHELPMHSHLYEQTGYMASGHMVLTIDGIEHDVTKGDSWCILENIPHGAKVIEDSIVIEIFSPPREDYKIIGRK